MARVGVRTRLVPGGITSRFSSVMKMNLFVLKGGQKVRKSGRNGDFCRCYGPSENIRELI